MSVTFGDRSDTLSYYLSGIVRAFADAEVCLLRREKVPAAGRADEATRGCNFWRGR